MQKVPANRERKFLKMNMSSRLMSLILMHLRAHADILGCKGNDF
jgi:hypothetical protein